MKEECHVITEVGIEVLQAKEHQGLLANHQKPGRGKAGFPPADGREIMALTISWFWIWPPEL